MSSLELAKMFQALPEYKPRSVELLRQLRASTAELYPKMNPGQRQRCFREMSDYARRSNAMADQLLKLKPIAIQVSKHDAVMSVFL
jgi:hypothetical protein